MSVREIEYKREAEALLNQPDGSLPPLQMLERLHRYGVWTRGNTNPRGTLTAPAKLELDANLMSRVSFYIGEGMETETCRKALLVIGQWGGEECLADPIRMLESDKTDSETRFYCLSAIRTIGGPRAVAAIARVLKSGGPQLQEAAINAILDLATGGSPSDIDSPADSSHVAPVQALEPVAAIDLAYALNELSEQRSVPFSLSYRAVDTWEYLKGKGALPKVEYGLDQVVAVWGAKPQLAHLGFGGKEQGLSQTPVSSQVRLIRADGREETVPVLVFSVPDPGKQRLFPLGPYVYLSHQQTVVLSLQIPEDRFPQGIARVSVSAVTSDEVEWPAGKNIGRGLNAKSTLEFAIPAELRNAWSAAPRLL